MKAEQLRQVVTALADEDMEINDAISVVEIEKNNSSIPDVEVEEKADAVSALDNVDGTTASLADDTKKNIRSFFKSARNQAEELLKARSE